MTNTKRRQDDLPVGIRLGFHKFTGFEMSGVIQKMIEARPTTVFADMKPGSVYLLRRSYYRDEVFKIVKMLPSGRQAVVRCPDGGAFTKESRIHEGSYRSARFVELDADLVALLGVTHEAVVADAVRFGIDVPPRVRVEHPALFVEIPERFAQDRGKGYREEYRIKPAAERVKESLSPNWGDSWPKRAVSAERVDKWIDEAHRQLAEFRAAALPMIAEGRCADEDLQRQEAEFFDVIDFWRWLRPLVDAGGVFYVEEKA